MAQVEKDTSVNDNKFSLHNTQSTLPTQEFDSTTFSRRREMVTVLLPHVCFC